MKQVDWRKTVLWVLFVTGLGAALRLVAFGSVPGGLYQDEAFNGLDALHVLEGEHPLYFDANNGREPLFIYLASLSIAGLGRTPAAVRLPAALLGTLTIPILAVLGALLFDRRVGLLGSTVMAITFWPLHLSRVAFRAVALPLFLALTLAAGCWGVQRSKRWWLLLAGLFYGLAFYTYLPVYFSLVVLALFGLYLWFAGRGAKLRWALPWFILGTAVALLPLLATFAAEPSLLWGRASQVSIFDPALNQGDLWGTLFKQIGRGLGMYVWRGDLIARHNLPGRPVFDWVMAPFFLLGLIWTLRNWRRPAAVLVLLWSLLMLVPTVLAEDAPHFLRAVGVLPLACLLPALGLDRFHRWLQARGTWRWLPVVALLVPMLLSLGLTVRDYFHRYPAEPQTSYAFQAAAVELADQMNAYDGPIWASVRFPNEWESARYLVGKDVHWIAEGAAPQQPSLPAVWFIWPYEPVEFQLAVLPPKVRFESWLGPLVKGDDELEPYPLYWGYRLQPADTSTAPPVARFENGISLLHASAQLDDSHPNHLTVSLEWTADSKLAAEYKVFVHVLASDGMVAQADSFPAQGTLPTTWWRPGDWVIDVYKISLSTTNSIAVHQIRIGLYRNDDLTRLAVLDSEGQPIGDSMTINLMQ